VENAWAASPLPSLEIIPVVLDLVEEAIGPRAAGKNNELVIELALAADALLRAEDIADLVPDWPLIESDASVAVNLREMLRRRRRWALDFERMMKVFRRQLTRGYGQLVEALPESYGDWQDEGDALLTVPLSSVLERPAATIENLILSIYDDEVFICDLFKKLRERFATNLLIASGFPPTTNPHEVNDRLVMPTRHRSRDGSELASLYLAGTPFKSLFNLPVPFSVPVQARFEHCHIIGGTGHGKTQLLQCMIHADLVAAQKDGRSVIVIDSQGDLIQKLLRLKLFDPGTPGSLADRLVLIDPADVEFPPSLNLFDVAKARLEAYGAVDRERTLNGLIELYETFFSDLLGAELTQKQGVIFRYLARLMLAIPRATIHTLMQLMEDGRPFKEHMEALDGSARYFFATEFLHPSFSATKKQILKRLWGVLSTPAFERMFAQRENKLDLFEATNNGSIILISTAKDLLKTDGSALFGRFFISMVAQAALERSAVPEHRRTPTLLYVDEAQEYFDDAIEVILTQARKYRVGMTLAHQTLDQLSPRLRAGILANTSFKCAGGVSSKDARALADELHTTAEVIEGMRRRHDRTEFAAWLKHRTPSAIRLDVPLGYLERQPTLPDETFDALLALNRSRHCGTLADVMSFAPPENARTDAARPVGRIDTAVPAPHQGSSREPALARPSPASAPSTGAPAVEHLPGKGGPKHRYLQTLVKELAEQQGFRATIEAPIVGGQADVLLEGDAVRVAVEISVTTPVEQERQNVRKCLAAGFSQIALVLTKSERSRERYKAAIIAELSVEEQSRVSFLAPEDLPDYIASLTPPVPAETVVRGYKVRVTHAAVAPEDARSRRDAIARIVSRSIGKR